MEEYLKIAGPIGATVAILCVVAAIIVQIIVRQLVASRESIRSLRVALERDPSPGQIGQALQQWPDVTQYPQTHQKAEMVKRAHQEEAARADRTERVKGVVRLLLFVAVLGVAIYITSRVYHPAPPPPPKVETPEA